MHAMAEVLAESEREIHCRVVHRGDSLSSVSRHLQRIFPGITGLSVRSVRRFCSCRGIYRSNISDPELDVVVRLIWAIRTADGRFKVCCRLREFVSQRRPHVSTSALSKDANTWQIDQPRSV